MGENTFILITCGFIVLTAFIAVIIISKNNRPWGTPGRV